MQRSRYLEHAGARLVDGVAFDFGDPGAEHAATRGGCGLFDLGHHDRLEIRGPDAADFLNRLLTCEVRKMPAGGGSPAFLLTGTGRIVAVFRLLRMDEVRFLVAAEPGVGAALREALEQFHFGEDLELIDLPDWLLVTLQGPAADDVLRDAAIDPPREPGGHAEATLAGLAVRVARHDRTGLGGYDVWVPTASFEAAWGALVGCGAQPAGAAALEMLRVEGGVAAWGHELGPESSPLEVTGLSGITEGKGCYPGQEVIERTIALGRPARTTLRVELEREAPAGTPLTLGRDEPQTVGTLTSVARLPDGRVVGLALVKRKQADAPELWAGEARARRLES